MKCEECGIVHGSMLHIIFERDGLRSYVFVEHYGVTYAPGTHAHVERIWFWWMGR